MGRQQPLQLQHLFEDFAGGEVANHAIEPAGAKRAVHGTAHLGADADGAMLAVVAQQHAFDPLAVGQVQQELFRAISAVRWAAMLVVQIWNSSASRSRAALGRSVIWSKAAARRSNSQCRTWAARYAGIAWAANQARSCSKDCSSRGSIREVERGDCWWFRRKASFYYIC